ncbi:MAG: hypothetical protein OQJ77_04305 [Thiovulaceae bacterium]|nr:hypothetical protein [Sulfurimonadaceae bacterium]MCW9026519.1 hypothetical protein [Sulfurimonadaceae bacterium]
MSSVNTSINNIYDIMNQPATSMRNIDSQKVLSVGSELQKNVQETQAAAQKGTTKGYQETLYKINLSV